MTTCLLWSSITIKPISLFFCLCFWCSLSWQVFDCVLVAEQPLRMSPAFKSKCSLHPVLFLAFIKVQQMDSFPKEKGPIPNSKAKLFPILIKWKIKIRSCHSLHQTVCTLVYSGPASVMYQTSVCSCVGGRNKWLYSLFYFFIYFIYCHLVPKWLYFVKLCLNKVFYFIHWFRRKMFSGWKTSP